MAISTSDLVGRAQEVATVAKDATSIANAVLVTLQTVQWDMQEQGTGGLSLLFAQRGEDTFDASADIPEHFSERNEAMHDDIALRAPQITLRGYIGELQHFQVPSQLEALRTVQTQLTTLSALSPALAVQALEAFNTAQQLYSTAAAVYTAGEQAFDLATGKEYENRQQKAFRYLWARYLNRSLFSVLTPWTLMRDMAIQNLRAIQDEETQTITEFSITFKQLRFASSELDRKSVV